jgi:hypothetical protein
MYGSLRLLQRYCAYFLYNIGLEKLPCKEINFLHLRKILVVEYRATIKSILPVKRFQQNCCLPFPAAQSVQLIS